MFVSYQITSHLKYPCYTIIIGLWYGDSKVIGR